MIQKKILVSLSVLTLLLAGVSARAADETNYQIKETTPAIQKALGGRQSRFQNIRALKEQGIVGENNQGFLEAVNPSSGAESLVVSENQDRSVIYNAIVEQNNLGTGGIVQVKKVFGEVQRERAKPGDLIQDFSGGWVKK